MLTGRSTSELRLDDLLNPVRPDFNHAFIVWFARASHAQNVLAGRNRIENHSPGSPHAALPFVVNINFSAGRGHHHQTRFSLRPCFCKLSFRQRSQFLKPFGRACGPCRGFARERMQNRRVNLRRNIGTQRQQRRCGLPTIFAQSVELGRR